MFKKIYQFKLALLVGMLSLLGTASANFSTKSVGLPKTTSTSAVLSNVLVSMSNGTLSNTDLSGLDLDLSNCGGSPLDDHLLDYLENELSDDIDTVDELQSEIDGLGNCDQLGAKWMLELIVDNSSDYPSSLLTASMVDDFIEQPGYTMDILGAADLAISSLQGEFDNDSFVTPLTSTAVKDLIWGSILAGFDSSDQAEEFYDNDDSSNFTLANFKSCYSSSDNTTGGSSACTTTSSEWDSISTIANAISGDNATELTASDITNIINADNSSLNSGVDLTNTAHLDFIKDCIDDLSDSASTDEAADCATSATQEEVVSYEIFGIFNDDYSGTVDTTMLNNAGIDDNVSTIAAGNTCGADQDESCITAVLESSSSFSSADDISTATISTVLADYFEDAVDNETTTVETASGTTGCDDNNTTFNVPNPPSLCRSFANWNCTSLTTGISVHWDDNGKGAVRADSSTFTGSSYQLRAKLVIGSVTRTKTLNGTFNLQAAVNGAQQGYKTGTKPGWWKHYDALELAASQCTSWGGTLAKYAEIQAANTAVSGTLVSDNTRVVFRANDGNATSVKTTNSNNGRFQCSEDFKQGSTNQDRYIYDTGPKAPECNGEDDPENFTFLCKDVPSCN